ncbi:unnamed protein product, partial [marine sediment metagenome]
MRIQWPATLERLAWISIDVWRISRARDCFNAAKELRAHEGHFPSQAMSIETQIAVLQNRHGVAMASRYAGDSKDAAERYAGILKELFQLLTSTSHGGFHVEPRRMRQILAAWGIATESGGDPPQFDDASQSEHLLVEQMLNSLERYADCYLFGRLSWSDSKFDEPAFSLETVHQILNTDPSIDLSERETLARVLCKISLNLIRRGDVDQA